MKLYYWFLFNLLSQVISISLAYFAFASIVTLWQAIFIGLAVLLLLNALTIRVFFSRYSRFIKTVEIALLHFKDGEFSLKIPRQKNAQLHNIANLFDQVATSFHDDRSSLLQRELLLDRVFETASSALLLTDSRDRITLCNPAARLLLCNGKPIKGLSINDILPKLPIALSEAITHKKEVLFSLHGNDGEPETWHFSCELFRLNGQTHTLYHFKQMTRTLSRAEVDTWKKVIRVFSHELNNSLSPISSLAHSGKHIVSGLTLSQKDDEMLKTIFTTIEHSATTLTQFLHNYAQFARLPSPILVDIHWPSFLAQLQELIDFKMIGDIQNHHSFADAGQLTQVLINLIKNAKEAGSDSDAIVLDVMAQGTWDKITVSDKGSGMKEAQLEQALLPFYSTKHDGTGLGLSLCREIIDAHHGRITLANRKEGGLKVSIWLPIKS